MDMEIRIYKRCKINIKLTKYNNYVKISFDENIYFFIVCLEIDE